MNWNLNLYNWLIYFKKFLYLLLILLSQKILFIINKEINNF